MSIGVAATVCVLVAVGCSTDTGRESVGSGHQALAVFVTPSPVLAPAGETLTYALYDQDIAGGIPTGFTLRDTLVATFAPSLSGFRYQQASQADPTSATSDGVDVDANGIQDPASAASPIGAEVRNFLPRPGTSLATGATFESASPSPTFLQGLVLTNSAAVLSHESSVVSAVISTASGNAIIRSIATHNVKLYVGAISDSADGPISSFAIADILCTPTAGCRLIRLLRLMPSNDAVDLTTLGLGDVFAMDHNETLVCLTGSSILTSELTEASESALDDVTQFRQCEQ
ncbi:MAG: hypothetical protein ACHREM_09015 [Polyangiales bacterium]